MRGPWLSIERPSERTQDIIMLGMSFFSFFFFFSYQATSTADQKKVWDGASLSQNG